MAAPGTGMDSTTHTPVTSNRRRGVPLQSTLRPVPLATQESVVALPDGSIWRGKLILNYTIDPIQ
eukprot:10917746-Alexandrium_andersonii.AAC.1